MTHPQRFIQDILARPGDDTPRLRYAAWLEAAGNPLGEFIRLQCALAQNHGSEPAIMHERRVQALLARFRTDWSAALAGCTDWCSFRRGFIEEIALSDRQLIKHAPALFGCAPVLDIHLNTDGKRLHALPELPELNHTLFLDLSSQRLGDESIDGLAETPLLSHVHGLNLGSSAVSDDGLDSLLDSPYLGSLRELYLNDNPIGDDGIRRLVMSPLADQLEFLDVRFTRIGEEAIGILKHVLGNGHLLYCDSVI